MKILHEIIDNIILAYVFICYYLMFAILVQNSNIPNKYKQNQLVLMTAAAPITVSYLIIKEIT